MAETPRPPKKLYKYRAFNNYLLDMLVADELFYADPSDFNDPLDSRPSLETDLETTQLEHVLRRMVEQRVNAEMTAAAKAIKYRGPKTIEHVARHSRIGPSRCSARWSTMLAIRSMRCRIRQSSFLVNTLRRSCCDVPPEPTPIEFLRLQYAGRQYLVHPSSLWWPDPPREWRDDLLDYQHYWRHASRWPPRGRFGRRPHFGWFAMEETAGTEFLKSLTGIIQDGGRLIPAILQLPSFRSIGFGLGGESVERLRDDAVYQYALFRDGPALLGDPRRGRLRGITIWSPKEGVFPQ